MLITGLGTPAFAQAPPPSDIVQARSEADYTFRTNTFPESTEVPALTRLGSPFGPAFPYVVLTTDDPQIVIINEPTALGGGLSDIFVVDPLSIVCPGTFVQFCFVSDDETASLQILLDNIRIDFANAGQIPQETVVIENGQLQKVLEFRALLVGAILIPTSLQIFVQSDVESVPNGGGGEAVGGTIIPIDMTALFVAGIFTNAFWVLPTLGGIAGALITLFKIKRKHS